MRHLDATNKDRWLRTLGNIERASTKSWGAQQDTLRTLHQALLESRLLHGCHYLQLTKAQETQLDILNRKAMRDFTGLLRFTCVKDLEQHAQINHLKDLLKPAQPAQECKASQTVCLQGTQAGRTVLRILDLLTQDQPALAIPLPPWDFLDVTGVKPLTPNSRP